MYVDSISLSEFRSFRKSSIRFAHPETRGFRGSGRPKLENVNLVIGANGSGKTTLLKGVALAALGPAVADSGLFPYYLVRREDGRPNGEGALIDARFALNAQDQRDIFPRELSRVESRIRVERRGDLELLRWAHGDEKRWHPIYSTRSEAFFFVGYGANRRVEKVGRVDEAARQASSFTRAQRIMSLFEEAYSLLPLSHWLPRYEEASPDRFREVKALVNRLLGRGRYQFTGEMESGEYVFRRGKVSVPFPALSDGYRAFLGWIGDLLYHVCETCPPGKELVKNQGIVMIDEVDLHMHPGWQLGLLPRLARQLPGIQFIVTSHSPLLVGSLEWQNVVIARQGSDGSCRLVRVQLDVSKLDADQILLTELFGLDSTRCASQTRRMRSLLKKTRDGDSEAARALMAELSGPES